MSSENTNYTILSTSRFLLSYFPSSKKVSPIRNKLLLLFFVSFLLFGFTAFITIYYWKKYDNEFDLILTCSHITLFLLDAIIINILIKTRNTLNEESQNLGQLSKGHSNSKYEKTGLSEAFSQELKNKLEYLMDNKKLYLKHNLKLDDVAEALDISRHHASQVINENFSMNFHDFINAHRIEDAKTKLCTRFNNSSDSISDIAYQCGFNNRVSFYKAFKKITHTTPTKFMEKAA